MSQLGYEYDHGPTNIDIMNSIKYATYQLNKQVCESDPTNYEWVPDPVPGYHCPEGLTCESGYCRFTKKGCEDYSEMPVFDCKRKKVSCSKDLDASGICEVCEYDIDENLIQNTPGPINNTPQITESARKKLKQCVNPEKDCCCLPGDLLYPDANNPNKDCCPGVVDDRTPYLIPQASKSQDGKTTWSSPKPLACKCDHDCTINGVGGECLLPSNLQPITSGSKNACGKTPDAGTPSFCYSSAKLSKKPDGSLVRCTCDSDCVKAGTGGVCYLNSNSWGGGKDAGKGFCYIKDKTVAAEDEQGNALQCNLLKNSSCAENQPCLAPVDPDPASDIGCNSQEARGQCFVRHHPYTEWREDFSKWGSDVVSPACVVNYTHFKAFCEYPWKRPGLGSTSDNSDPNNCSSVQCPKWSENDWKTKAKVPYWYNSTTGKCHMTKDYCVNNIGQGGYDTAYGDQKNYWLFSNCNYPKGQNNEIESSYDCCTNLGKSIAQFFFGRSLPAEFDDILANPGAHAGQLAGAALLAFLSDKRLKTDIKLIKEHGGGKNIHLYEYKWSPHAQRLYNKPEGVVQGLLAQEIERIFPNNIRWSSYGHKMFVHTAEDMPKWPNPKVLVYLRTLVTLINSGDLMPKEGVLKETNKKAGKV
jgi:hypothetical protein